MILEKALDLISDPEHFYSRLIRRVARMHIVSDKLALKLIYRSVFGKSLDLANPLTFNEKLQWLKLYDRNPLYNTLADKYAVKAWVAERIGSEYVPKTYGVWYSVDDIILDELPERFVLKTNHDNGGVVVCSDRSSFDFEEAKIKLNYHLQRNFYWLNREWPYRDVKPLVYAEEYLTPEKGEEHPNDYKILCFGGLPKLIEVHKGRYSNCHYQDWYDCDWNRLDIAQPGTFQSSEADERPQWLQKALELSGVLSEGLPHIRVDWFYSENRLFLGELTLYDGAGFEEFIPEYWDERLGSWIDLNRAFGGSK